MIYKTLILMAFNVAFLSACSTVKPTFNKVATKKPSNRFVTPEAKKQQNELMLILTFSGGGTRAAALSYGVLKGLRDTKISHQKNKSLLSEVDMISSVSGGSFTAAYYGLFGDKIFTDYEKDFLKSPVQSHLLDAWLFSPSNWSKLATAAFNRTDLAADYYDKYIFKRKTFTDMRADAPHIMINSTDVSTGNSFAFTPEHMRWICSDLSSYPVSRAVAASSAVPGAFTPIALKNHQGCELFPYQNRTVKVASNNDKLNLGMRKYLDKKRYPYLHLVDGGISDNLGIRSIFSSMVEAKDHLPTALKTYGLEKTKKVAFIIVNSADDIPPRIAQSPYDPGVADVIGAVTTLQSRRYNIDTLDLLNIKFDKWTQQMREHKCGESANLIIGEHCDAVDFYAIELNLKQLPKKLAEETSLYATSLELPSDQVDKLIHAGQYLLKNSPEFQAFIKDIVKSQ